MIWTDEIVEKVKTLNALGWSGRRIGDEFGVSRNAVIGLMHRRGIKTTNPPAVKKERKRPVRNGGATIAALKAQRHERERAILRGVSDNRAKSAALARAVARGEISQADPFALPVEKPARPPVELLDLEFDQCRWPICDDGNKLMGFCGEPWANGRIWYCAHHFLMAYRDPQDRPPRHNPRISALACKWR